MLYSDIIKTFIGKEEVDKTAYGKSYVWEKSPEYSLVHAKALSNGKTTGSGIYKNGTAVTIKAIPNAGYHFVKWSDENTNAERNFVITADVKLEAIFSNSVGKLTYWIGY